MLRIKFISALVWICVTSAAQNPVIKNNILFGRVSSRDGLSDNETHCVFEDSRGFMWIGTSDGLNLYSANAMTVYRNDPHDSMSLPDNIVHSIAEDRHNNLWIGTVRGLSRMNLSTRRIEQLIKTSDHHWLTATHLLCDRNGKIWSAGFGIGFYDESTGTYHHYFNDVFTEESVYKKSNTINCIYEDSNGKIWVGTHTGLFQFDPATGKFTTALKFAVSDNLQKQGGVTDIVVSDIIEDHNHQIWLGTWGMGLVKFNPSAKSFSSFDVYSPVTKDKSVFNIVNKVAETKDESGEYHFWLSTDQGFAEFFEKINTLEFQLTDPTDPRSIAKSNIRQLYPDGSGMLWIVTDTQGLEILDPHRQSFKTHYFKTPNGGAGDFGSVTSFLSLHDTTFVTTWYGQALYQLNKNLDIVRQWQHIPPEKTQPANNRGQYLVSDGKGSLWIPTLNGLHALNLKKNSFTSFYNSPVDSASLPRNRLVRYFQDSEGTGWVCFYKNGFCKFNPRTGKFYEIHKGIQHQPGVTSYFNIWDIIEDHEHNVWLADDALGLWKYNRSDKSFVRVLEHEIQEGHISALFEDSSNTIWIATRNGLGKIKNGVFQLLTTADGLPGNSVFDISEDQRHRLWLLTNQGLVMMDLAARTFRVFKEEDGLEKTSIDGAVLTSLSDGRMLIGSNNYITEFNPATITAGKMKSPVWLTGMKVSGKPFQWVEKDNKKTATLAHNANQLNFEFCVLNFSDPASNHFYYQLGGFEKTWTSSSLGFANYTNLDPGTYVFRVKGVNSAGVVNEAGDLITITITPPFWSTWWFILGAVIISGMVIFVLARFRLQQALQLERMRTRISADLHDDIGSTLSSISILSSLILKEPSQPSAKSMITEINTNSILLMERMDDIVWSIHPGNDNLAGFLLRIRNFAAVLFEARGIRYDFQIQENIQHVKLAMEARQNIYLILKEAVNNIVKYAGCACATIVIRRSNSLLEIVISDDGKGFDTSLQSSGNGIRTMLYRARALRGDLQIESAPGKGTRINLAIKIK